MTPAPPAPWPGASAGPASPTYPLAHGLLRLIAGSPRFRQGAVEWLISPTPHDTLDILTATLQPDGTTASITLPADINTPAPTRFDFTLPDTPTCGDHIAFTVGTLRGSLMLSDVPPDAGVLRVLLNDLGGVPMARLRLTYARISAHSLGKHTEASDMLIPRFTGHRGMGSSGAHAPWRFPENTTESLAAAVHGDARSAGLVTAVELDIQPTRCGRPVVFHDWFVRPSGADAVRLPVHSLTASQMDALVRAGDAERPGLHPKAATKRARMHAVGLANDSLLDGGLRSLGDVCDVLPEDVEILVEIKFPPPDVQADLALPYPQRDSFVNAVLDELLPRARHRALAFLCFEPDVCDMLRAKQQRAAVYLSHSEVIDRPCDELDPRTVALQNGLRFAQDLQLHGIMMHNALVTMRPSVIADIVKAGLPILTYGKSNSQWECVKHQFDRGVSGVIADDVHDLVHDLQDRQLV